MHLLIRNLTSTLLTFLDRNPTDIATHWIFMLMGTVELTFNRDSVYIIFVRRRRAV